MSGHILPKGLLRDSPSTRNKRNTLATQPDNIPDRLHYVKSNFEAMTATYPLVHVLKANRTRSVAAQPILQLSLGVTAHDKMAKEELHLKYFQTAPLIRRL
jgi:hypothetical protein